jgi:hypothetical protein
MSRQSDKIPSICNQASRAASDTVEVFELMENKEESSPEEMTADDSEFEQRSSGPNEVRNPEVNSHEVRNSEVNPNEVQNPTRPNNATASTPNSDNNTQNSAADQELEKGQISDNSMEEDQMATHGDAALSPADTNPLSSIPSYPVSSSSKSPSPEQGQEVLNAPSFQDPPLSNTVPNSPFEEHHEARDLPERASTEEPLLIDLTLDSDEEEENGDESRLQIDEPVEVKSEIGNLGQDEGGLYGQEGSSASRHEGSSEFRRDEKNLSGQEGSSASGHDERDLPGQEEGHLPGRAGEYLLGN